MFVRNVILNLKPEALKDLTQILTNDVLPLLRKQNGFRDELICVSPDHSALMALSFWDTKENFDAYAKTVARTDVLKAISKVSNGSLKEESLELYLSTNQQLAASQKTAKA